MKHRITQLLSGVMALMTILFLACQEQAEAFPAPQRRFTAQAALSAKASEGEAAEGEEFPEEDGGEEDAAGAPAGETTEVSEKERPEGERNGPEILAESQLIAHGMGAVDGITILNCLEGFQAQYEAGVRVFEVDIRLTRDVKAVLRHDWRMGWQKGVNEASIPTLEQFLSEKILGEYTPLSFRDLLLLMEEYPDICVITDTKFTEPDMYMIEFDAMVNDARELGLSYLFDRMIIQIYNKNMFTALHSEFHFPHYIYTLYNEGYPQTSAAFRDKAVFCSQRGIGGIAMWDSWWKSSYIAIAEEYGVHVYAHTVNDQEQSKSLFERGVDAVYTDTLTPNDFMEPSSEPDESIPTPGL